jgi:hypothetical protein
MANGNLNVRKKVKTRLGDLLAHSLSSNGRVNPDVVLVNGEQERHQVFKAGFAV